MEKIGGAVVWVVIFVTVFVGVSLLGAIPLSWMWNNYLVPALAGNVNPVGYIQMFWIVFLTRFLFQGFGSK